MPKIPQAEQLLKQVGRRCDVGCGKGLSTLLLASEYDTASFFGYDIHAQSIHEANTEVQCLGLSYRLQFKVINGEEYAGKYDIITFFDCLHNMCDPLGVACYARSKLTSCGWVILIEPSACDHVKDNIADWPNVLFALENGLCAERQISESRISVRFSSRCKRVNLVNE